MLILVRKQLEAIDCYLPDESIISVIVTRIGHNSVRLGIVAPDNVKILRREVPVNQDSQSVEGDAA